MSTDNLQGKLPPFMQKLLHLPSAPVERADAGLQEQPYLIGSRCGDCGHVAFPPREVCPACLNDGNIRQVPLSRKGQIDTYTVSRVAPPGFEAPYIQAFVRLPEGPRIFTLITDCPPVEGALEIGQEVELVVERLSRDEQGNELIGYKFRPVKG